MSIETKRIMYIIIIFSILVFLIFQNSNIKTTTIKYSNDKLPKSFDNFTIIQVSDLHNKRFGKDQAKLLNKVKKENPDIILVTGDLIDRRRYDLETSMLFIDGAVEIAPVYYVSGNHEAWSLKYDEIKDKLIKAGVVVLDNKVSEIFVGKSKIEVIGVMDPAFDTPEGIKDIYLSNFIQNLNSLSQSDNFKILLSHRPELFDIYVTEEIDLTFSGHAHGGQFRLPLIGGLFAPHQGFFPKYTSGKHKISEYTLVVSRGLGNSLFPLRIFNNPEIVKVILQKENDNEK